MCSGAVYWAGIGRVVYGQTEHDLKVQTGAHVENPTLDLPCRIVFEAGQRPTEIVGPLLEEESAQLQADYWKNRSAVDFSQKSRLTTEAQFSSLSDWASLQAKLGSVQTVVGIDMIAFNINEARLDIAYVGTLDQLRGTLADAGIAMTSRGGKWWLSRNEGGP